jgi:hypothetical protein
MTAPAGTFIHALRVSPTLQTVQRRLYVSVSPAADPPERVPGNCPAVGYTLSEWGGIGCGTHHVGMVIRAFESFAEGDEQPFLAALDHPLTATVTPLRPEPGRPEVVAGANP